MRKDLEDRCILKLHHPRVCEECDGKILVCEKEIEYLRAVARHDFRQIYRLVEGK